MPYTVVLDWSTGDYADLLPLALYVHAAGPLAALRDAFVAAVEQTRHLVRDFQTSQGAEDLIEEAMEIFHHVATFEGTHRPVDFREYYG